VFGAFGRQVSKPIAGTRPTETISADDRDDNRWWTPLGLEPVPVAASVREDPPVTDGDPGGGQDARGHERTRAVASLATALADAVLAGDQERARALAEKLRALAARS